MACIQAWPFLKNIHELTVFLGLCSYYRSYIKKFVAIAEPLTQCLRKGIALENTENKVEDFEKLKSALMDAPILGVPRDDPSCKWVVDSDASSHAAAAVHQKWQDRKLRAIEYASQVFNRAERNYCATRRELTAVIFALKVFRPYLLGRHFGLCVNNMAISFLMKVKNPARQAARYMEFLADYEFDLSHRKGASNVNADGLSKIPPCAELDREPCQQCQKRVIGRHDVKVIQTRSRSRAETLKSSGGGLLLLVEADEYCSGSGNSDCANRSNGESDEADNDGRNVKFGQGRKRPRRSRIEIIAPQAWEKQALGWGEKSLRDAQLKDPNIGPALGWCVAGKRPDCSEVDCTSPMLCALWRQFESIKVMNRVLYRLFYDTNGEVFHEQLVLLREL